MAGTAFSLLNAHENPYVFVAFVLGYYIQQLIFLLIKTATQPVAHRATGVSDHATRCSSADTVLTEYAMNGKLKCDTCHLASVALQLELYAVAQFRLALASFLACLVGVVALLATSALESF